MAERGQDSHSNFASSANLCVADRNSTPATRKAPQFSPHSPLRLSRRAACRLLLATPALAASPGPELVWTGPSVTLLGAPSPDGRSLSFADPITGSLSLHDSSGADRVIAPRPPGSREFAYFSVFSRDGAHLAYAWSNSAGFYELRLAAVAGGPARTIYRNEQAGFVQPCAFTPDNKQILTLLFRRDNTSQIALIPIDGGPPRVLRSLNWVYPKRMDVSPDGRWLVYDNFAEEGKQDRALFLLAVDGAKERRIAGLPRNALFPLWHSRSVYFAGDDGGPQSIYRLPIDDGQAAAPAPISGPLGRVLLLGIGGGRLFFGSRLGAPDVFVARPGAEPARVASQWNGRNSSAALSPDGRLLAYLSRRGAENYGQQSHSIVVNEAGKEREIDPRMAHLERLAWSPDGTRLLVAGSDGKGRAGLFLVDVRNAATTVFAATHDGPFRGYQAAWSADARRIFYLRGDTELTARTVESGEESVLLKAPGLHHLAADPAGSTLAIGMGGVAIRLTPIASDQPARIVSFPGLTDLAWGKSLLAGRGEEVWQVPLDGAPPQRLFRAAGRQPGLSASRDGRIAFHCGADTNAIFSLKLP